MLYYFIKRFLQPETRNNFHEKQYKKIEDEVSKYNENLIDSELFRNKFINLLAIYNNIFVLKSQ